MQVLDTDFRVIKEFTDEGDRLSETNFLVDGSVDLDISRGTRRTFTATLLNPDGEFSPDSAWAGTFYVNRLIRLYRGIAYTSGQSEVVPIGTFMIDHADTVAERNMSMVVLSGSDLWKKVGKSVFPNSKSWASGTPLITVFKDIASAAGVTQFVDDLSDDRTGDSANLNKKFTVEQGDNRGEWMTTLATAYGVDVYFDQLGRMVIADFRSPEDTRTVWTFDPTVNRMTLTVKSTYQDDNLYNHVLVIGTGGKTPVVSQLKDTKTTSVTNINRIGDRVYKYETDSISTQEAADRAAKRLFYKNVLVNEDISLDAICNPALDGNDIVTVRESEFTKLDDRYRIKRLTVPLASSRQEIGLGRAISLV